MSNFELILALLGAILAVVLAYTLFPSFFTLYQRYGLWTEALSMVLILIGGALSVLLDGFYVTSFLTPFIVLFGLISNGIFRNFKAGQKPDDIPVCRLKDETYYIVLACGGRDVRIREVPGNSAPPVASFQVTFAVPSGKYYQTNCN